MRLQAVCGTVLVALGLGLGSASAMELDELDGGVQASPDGNAVERGRYILHAGGCITCHTAENGGVPLAGGRPMETDFGTFYTPNITPDQDTGIGDWTRDQFRRAVRRGIAPDGSVYYPSFPYTSYAGMREEDVDDLYTYLMEAVQPVSNETQSHELRFPYNFRVLLRPWRWMYFDSDGYVETREGQDSWNRGAYLTNALGHCGECHTPRNSLGAMDLRAHLKGAPATETSGRVPDITRTGAKTADWDEEDMDFFLMSGFYPDYDVPGGGMGAVIFDNTSHLTEEDRAAMVEYLMSLE